MDSQVGVAPHSARAQAPTNPLLSFMPMLVVLGILYFLVIRPQQKQAKEHRRMVSEMKVGDKVLTQGGIYGTVSAINGDIVQVRIADNVRVNVARTSITQVIIDTPTPVAGVSVS